MGLLILFQSLPTYRANKRARSGGRLSKVAPLRLQSSITFFQLHIHYDGKERARKINILFIIHIRILKRDSRTYGFRGIIITMTIIKGGKTLIFLNGCCKYIVCIVL